VNTRQARVTPPGGRRTERRLTVTRQVVDTLFELLRSGEYRVGDQLPSEWELVSRLKVGRSAVREAIRELVTLELVELRPGRGTFVRSLRSDLLLRPETFDTVVATAVKRELLEVRRILEPEAAALAADRVTDAEVERLRHDVERLREQIERLVVDPELRARMGASGRTRYEREFTLAHSVNRTLDVYRDVLNSPR